MVLLQLAHFEQYFAFARQDFARQLLQNMAASEKHAILELRPFAFFLFTSVFFFLFAFCFFVCVFIFLLAFSFFNLRFLFVILHFLLFVCVFFF